MKLREGIRVILASASPRRRELLMQMGITEFEVLPAAGEEVLKERDPVRVVQRLSYEKAAEVYAKCTGASQGTLRGAGSAQEETGKEAHLIIGADTLVALDGEILGKPADRKDAVRMLSMLSGKTHRVLTGVTLIWDDRAAACAGMECGAGHVTFHAETGVTFANLTEKEIRSYVDSGESDDKAGAYGAQGVFARHVAGVNGEYTNVYGLPVAALYAQLAEKGFFV